MASLWTPSGEHPVTDQPDAARVAEADRAPRTDPGTESLDTAAQVEALRQRLAGTPADAVVANHCYGLFELGAIYLSADPPQLAEARLAIDAFGFLVEGLGERLGQMAGPLRDALAQIRLGFVQVEAAQRAADGAGSADAGSDR